MGRVWHSIRNTSLSAGPHLLHRHGAQTAFLLLLTLAAPLIAERFPSATAVHKVRFPGTSMSVARGMALRNGDELTIAIANGNITFQSRSRKPSSPTFTVLAREVTEIIYKPVRFRRSRQVWKGGDPLPGPCGPDCGGLGLVYLGLGITWLSMHPLHGIDHYVSIGWRCNSVLGNIVVQPSKDNYQALLGDLQEATCLNLSYLGQVNEPVLAALPDNRVSHLALDRKVVVSGSLLTPGQYQFALLLENRGEAELLIFVGDEPSQRRLMAFTMVKVFSAYGPAVEVTYGRHGGAPTITKIRTPEKEIRLTN